MWRELGEDLQAQVLRQVRVLEQELARTITPLPQAGLPVAEPGAAPLEDPVVDAQVEDLTQLVDALVEQDVELHLAERRSNLVLDDRRLGPRANGQIAVLQRADPTDVDPDRRVELQRASAGRRLRTPEHHADLLADLVDEDQAGVRLGDEARELAERLAHQAGLEADEGVAHLPLDLRLRDERRDGVDDDDVDRAGARERLADVERLLTVVRLGDQQRVEVDAELARILGIERVFGVDEGGHPAAPLRRGDHVQGQRRLSRRFRPEDLDHAAPGETPPADREVETE